MGPIWGRQDPGGPHVGPINFAIWDDIILAFFNCNFLDNRQLDNVKMLMCVWMTCIQGWIGPQRLIHILMLYDV